MNRIAVIDAETDPFKHDRLPEPFIWGFYDGERYEEFFTTESLVEFLSDQEIIVYAHNGGKFDFHFLMDYVNLHEELTVINGRIGKMKIGDCELRDSWLILPIPLASYKKDEIDYSIMEPHERVKPENMKKIRDYLYKDCLYLRDIIVKFLERYDNALTMAGASMKQWRKISKRKPPTSTRSYYGLLRPYYYGGRVQCFRVGIIEEEFELADINSAYPFAMLYKHPIGTDYQITKCAPQDHETFAASLLKVRCKSHGAFPYRTERGELIFPNDNETREYCVTGWEFLAAKETDTIRQERILEYRVFDELTDFSDYINHFYSERLQAQRTGDKAGNIFAKLFMNSLYGKFASNPDRYRHYQLVPLEYVANAEEENWTFAGEIAGFAIMEKPLNDKEMHFYNIATAASITGFVRAYLWQAICASGNPIYCDTDSLAAGDLSRLNYGDELGAWKTEMQGDFAAVAGKKLYAFKSKKGTFDSKKERQWKTASKGVNIGANDIIRVARGEIVEYKPEVPTYSVHSGPRFISRKLRITG